MTAQQWTGGKRQGPCCREGRRRGCTTPTPTAADVTHSWSFCWVNRLKNLCCLQKQNLPSPSFDSRHLPQAQWNNIIKPGSLSSNIFILNGIFEEILLKIKNFFTNKTNVERLKKDLKLDHIRNETLILIKKYF